MRKHLTQTCTASTFSIPKLLKKPSLLVTQATYIKIWDKSTNKKTDHFFSPSLKKLQKSPGWGWGGSFLLSLLFTTVERLSWLWQVRRAEYPTGEKPAGRGFITRFGLSEDFHASTHTHVPSICVYFLVCLSTEVRLRVLFVEQFTCRATGSKGRW